MNFSIYIYGSPSGYNQYPADSNSDLFQDLAQNKTTESQLTVCRKGQLVYYSYMRSLQEKSNNYLGFCLIFNGVYCQNSQKLFELFDSAFDDVLLKGEMLKFEKDKIVYTVSKFAEKSLEIERIKTFFKEELENNFYRDFVALPTSFKVGNGKKSISVKEANSDILSVIAEFDCVHITNNEKSLSELERTHKMLNDLYADKQNLDAKYRKLLAQKKQYKVVILLCLVVISCAAGLFAFNSSLKSRDSQIHNLNNQVKLQQTDIENLNTNIVQLQGERADLTVENSKLISNLQEIRVEKENLLDENMQLDRENNNLRYKVSNLESQNNSYRSENTNLQSKNRGFQQDISTKESEIKKLKKSFNVQIYLDKDLYNSGYGTINLYGPIVITVDPTSNMVYTASGIKSADIYSTDLEFYKKR